MSPKLFLYLCSALFVPGTLTGLVGNWETPKGDIIEIYNCGSNVCAKLARLSPAVPVKTDRNNPDPDRRGRQLCGLQIGDGFVAKDPGSADGGHLYDPESGRTYSGSMIATGDDLKLRGYIGISLLGRTEHWRRSAEKVDVCPKP